MRPSIKKHIANIAFCTFCVLLAIVALGMIFAGYAGTFSPEIMPWAGIWAMTYGGWLVLLLVLCIVAVCIRRTRWLALAFPIAVALTWFPFLNFCPLNFFHSSKAPEGQEKNVLTVLSYNTHHGQPFDGKYPGGISPLVTFILQQDPDIALLQEFEPYCVPGGEGSKVDWTHRSHITQKQYDSLTTRFPHHAFVINQWKGLGNAIFSKYPIKWMQFDYPGDGEIDQTHIAGFKVVPPSGDTVNVYIVHLESFGVTNITANLYSELQAGEGTTQNVFSYAKLAYRKLTEANQRRAQQARWLRNIIERDGGSRILVAGDFNDISGSYAVRTLCGTGPEQLRQTWRSVGIGPLHTFHAYSLYVHIDHILWGGSKIRPLSMSCIHVPYSDHYPLRATYLLEP